MRSRLFAVVFGVLAGSALLAQAAPISLNFSSLPGSTIQFNGSASTFSFNPSGADQWWITSINNGVGDSLALHGRFSGGPWTYGGITTTGPNQHASVISPLGTITLFDGTGGTATGAINWVDVDTYQFAGALNGSAAVNLTGLTYTPGTTPISDLQQVVAGGLGSALLTFQFNPGMTLTDLTSGTGPYRTSYSGSIAAIPEPGIMALTLFGLLPLAVRSFRSKR